MQKSIVVTPMTRQEALAGVPKVARTAFRLAEQIQRGTLEATLPDSRTLIFKGAVEGPTAQLRINDYRFAWRLMRSGDIGIAEAYLRGEWETPDLTRFLYLFCVNQAMLQSVLAHPLVRWVQAFRHWLNRNTRRQARKNIHAHYDLGNTFYKAWLDPSMTYSSALFDKGSQDLSAAQMRKYESLAHQIDLKTGHTVLEIGCGWGGFAEYAAKNVGANVIGLTISKEQFDYARRRIFEAGLSEKVDIRLQDYRDERGLYDRIASIEMLEAVGEQYWPDYFRQLRDRLVPGGLAGIQTITIQDDLFPQYRREIDFIRRYVFPGGMLPTPSKLKALGQSVGLPLAEEKVFGEDYARTLADWRERFRAAWPTLTPFGFDERFRRLWEYYLSYCEAGFLSGNIDVRQMVFTKSA
jgi:cyclopropane-fatty-acyl-phospholipid synthase